MGLLIEAGNGNGRSKEPTSGKVETAVSAVMVMAAKIQRIG